MTYFESAAGERMSLARALRECDYHGCAREEFLAECGVHDSYDAQSVLRWLGY